MSGAEEEFDAALLWLSGKSLRDKLADLTNQSVRARLPGIISEAYKSLKA